MNENFNTFRQQVLRMDIDLKLQLEQDILVITDKFDQQTKFNTAYSRLGHMIELMGIEVAQVALVEMYRRSKSLDSIVNTFNSDNDDQYDYVNFIDLSIPWFETKYPRGYRKSSDFWGDIHRLFIEESHSFDFDWIDSCKGMSIREVLMHNTEGSYRDWETLDLL